MMAPPVDANTNRSTPASAAPRSISNVPRALISKFSTGSATDSTTDPNAARWITRSTPRVARATASGSRMSPTTRSISRSGGSSSREPRTRLSKTRTSCEESSCRSRFAPMNPAPPVTRTRLIGACLLAGERRGRAQLVRGLAPVHARHDQAHVDPVTVLDRDVHERVEQRLPEVVRLQTEVEQRRVRGVVVVLGGLDAGVVEPLDLGRDAELHRRLDDELSQLADRE